MLYAHGTGEVTLDDVMACVADASELKIDPIVDGAFAGNPTLVETEFNKAMIAGTYPGMIMMAAQRQAAALHKTSLLVEAGTPARPQRRVDFRVGARARWRRHCAISQHDGWQRSSISSRWLHWMSKAERPRRSDRAEGVDVDCRECKAAGISPLAVMHGPDPGIHLCRKHQRKLDGRVKPGHDGARAYLSSRFKISSS